MNGTFSDTVVPFRGSYLLRRNIALNFRMTATKTYHVTAYYDYPPVERSVMVEAEDPQRAMVKSLLEGKVPALFRKDEFGWLLPIFWHPRLAGGRRWPTIIGRNVIAWGEKNSKGKLIFGVDEVKEKI
jgi:hypothetical protein